MARISPEAPVPVVDFERESFMPGGAANVARNLDRPGRADGIVRRGRRAITPRRQLKQLLAEQHIGCGGLLAHAARPTSMKTRIVAHQQQVVRIDRETRDGLDGGDGRSVARRALKRTIAECGRGDRGRLRQRAWSRSRLLDEIKAALPRARDLAEPGSRNRCITLNLSRLSLITPNRKEAFELREHAG